MELLNLPPSSVVNRVVPKNSFDAFATPVQRRRLSEAISRITWTHKIASTTVNLDSKEIQEIQIFRIELKTKEQIPDLLELIDRAVPYTIIFAVQFDEVVYISTTVKHAHPTKPDNAVLDWTFRTEWFGLNELPYRLKLQLSIDKTYRDFCAELAARDVAPEADLASIVSREIQLSKIEKEIALLKAKIRSEKQFNRKVEMNLRLRELEKIKHDT